MNESVDDLIAFLRARLDELEADFDGHFGRCYMLVNPAEAWCTCGGGELLKADVAAKRGIVSLCLEGAHFGHENVGEWMYGVLRLLAVPFASHPDFREEWRTE